MLSNLFPSDVRVGTTREIFTLKQKDRDRELETEIERQRGAGRAVSVSSL
jgi:hypothetical protein